MLGEETQIFNGEAANMTLFVLRLGLDDVDTVCKGHYVLQCVDED